MGVDGKYYYYYVIVACVLFCAGGAATAADDVNKSKEEASACVNGSGGISLGFDLYLNSCPEAEPIVFSWVEKAVSDDPRMAASLLRLHFHDCFVNVRRHISLSLYLSHYI